MSKSLIYILVFVAFFKFEQSLSQELSTKKQVLVFYKTEGFHHKSVETAKQTIKSLGKAHHFMVTSTKDAKDFLKANLQDYDLVIFANTTGNVFNEKEQVAFQNYIENGGSLFGIHSATDTEGDWPYFVELIGGFFDGHPKIQNANVEVNMPDHPTVSHLPKVWSIKEEWYNFKHLNPDVQVLLYLDENSYKGGTNGKNHPIAWYQETGYGGISIYTGLGHSVQSYQDTNFKEHVLQCILYALGDNKE